MRRVRFALLVMTAAIVGLPAPAAAAPPGPPEPPPDPGTIVQLADPNAPGRLVPLITGDVIRVTGEGAEMRASVEYDAEPVGDVSIARVDKTVYAVPGVAGMLLAKGALDPRLFDISQLLAVAEQAPAAGFAATGDGQTAMKGLPLIVQYTGTNAPPAPRAMAAQPTKELPSIHARAVAMAKDDARALWADVTDPVATSRAEGAPQGLTLAPSIKKVWLDGVVHADLDVSRRTVGADKAWAAGYDGTGVKVAVLDTGVDTNHPDLADRVLLAKSFVPGEPPADNHYHGTHVASTLAGSGAASDGEFAGVAPGARLLNGKVLDSTGSGSESQIIEGMQWAADNGANLVSMSLGGSPTDGTAPLDQALNELSRTHNLLFVVAAGNNNNRGQSVGTPGAADLALTVSNVDTQGFGVDGTSSVGPRLGDYSIKPEISAPGTNIVAALRGTDGYTELTGTSMSTPHVAGVAAILLQKHPDWTGQQIKDALIGSAAPTKNSFPVYYQGSGVVRADRALDATVTATGTLNLGAVPFPQEAGRTVSGTVTYANHTDAAMTLELAATFEQAPPGFTRQSTPFEPPDGSVELPGSVVVPANGTADVTVTVDVSRMPYASVFGRLSATVAGSAPVTTLLSWTREVEKHQLKLRAVDRDGKPAESTIFSVLWLWDLRSGSTPLFVVFDKGVGYVQDRGFDPRLEAGRYALMGVIGGFGPAPREPLRSWTFVSEPEIVMNQARAFTFDARKAGEVKLRTARYTAGGMGENHLIRKIPGHEFSVQPGAGSAGLAPPWADKVYTLAGGKSSTGTFEWKNFTRLERPRFIFRSHGASGPIPGTPPPNATIRLLPQGKQRMVDVGDGPTPDATAPGLRGALALWRPATGWDTWIRGAADAVAAAGARGLVIVLPADVTSALTGPQPDWPASGPLPIAELQYDDAKPLLAKPPRGGTVHVESEHSPYAYLVVTRQLGGLRDGRPIEVREKDMVRQDVNYRGDPATFCGRGATADADRNTSMNISSSTGYPGVPCGTRRQEFFSPDVTFTTSGMSPGLAYVPSMPNIRWNNTEVELVRGEAGDRGTVDVGAGPWVPGYSTPVTLTQAHPPWAITVLLNGKPGFGFGPGLLTTGPDAWNTLNNATYSRYRTVHTRLLRDGQVVCDGDASMHQSTCTGVTPGARYQLDMDVAQTVLPLSTSTHSVWNFTMTAPAKQGETAVQPVLMLDWTLGTDLHNRVQRARPTDIEVTPYFARGYPAYGGDFTGTLWASYDDGATWTKAGTDKASSDEPLRFRARTPGKPGGYASYRVTVTDDAGNSVDQTVIKAAYAPSH